MVIIYVGIPKGKQEKYEKYVGIPKGKQEKYNDMPYKNHNFFITTEPNRMEILPTCRWLIIVIKPWSIFILLTISKDIDAESPIIYIFFDNR